MAMKERRLPSGMTPRLLSKEAAAAYCGMSSEMFDGTIGKDVPPIDLQRRRNLWDIKALDRWIDQQSGFTHAERSIGDWAGMLGNDRQDQRG
jgi:hypothetical protein